jgi:hypothetical protein
LTWLQQVGRELQEESWLLVTMRTGVFEKPKGAQRQWWDSRPKRSLSARLERAYTAPWVVASGQKVHCGHFMDWRVGTGYKGKGRDFCAHPREGQGQELGMERFRAGSSVEWWNVTTSTWESPWKHPLKGTELQMPASPPFFWRQTAPLILFRLFT